MDDKEFKQYKYAKSNLQVLAVLVFIGFAFTGYQAYLQSKTGLEWFNYADLGLITISAIAAVGIFMWKHWARITLAVMVGINLALLIVVHLVILPQYGIPVGSNSMLTTQLGIRTLLGIYFLSILLNKRAVQVMDYQGDLQRLRTDLSGFAQAQQATAG